ncbi:MAG: PUA domain-containing protein [Zestosphaera sp.]
MSSYPLRKKELKKIEEYVTSQFPKLVAVLGELESGFITELESVGKQEVSLVILNGLPAFIQVGEDIKTPTLVLVKMAGIESTQYAVVDEGAVKHLLNGADVMSPGITECSGFQKEALVTVWNPKKETPLCIGKALMSCDEIMSIRKGKAIKNIHYAGDKIWKKCLEILAKKS